eukprot:Nitzschia sp. Nitz4//scaffold189_size62959//59156//59602//NITZ4_006318-RA/size62959-snap-gene-0.5-mRNA-1//1//CDS//3329539926//8009//frame0
MDAWERKVGFVRRHYEKKGYRVHSGLQFGCELVLYADDPQRVHSDFCIHVMRDEGLLEWREIQTLVRSMPDLHKTLILANVVGDLPENDDDETEFTVQELAVATEHAPFRHKQKLGLPGTQRKKQKTV